MGVQASHVSRLEQRKRERENKAAMEADLQVALAEKEVIAQQVRTLGAAACVDRQTFAQVRHALHGG